MKKLGETQRDVLRSLKNHNGYWHAGCGWNWDTFSGTVRIMESLLKRGFVEKCATGMHSERYPRYNLTKEGRDA